MTKTATETPAEAPQLLWLDPAELVAHPATIRTDLRNLLSLTRSIKANGVIEPLVVAPDEHGWRIIAGQRRAQAAIAADVDRVPAISRPDLLDDAGQVVVMTVENVQRDALTDIEEARAYEQLAAFGLSARTIAQRTGTKAARVKAGLAVAGNDTVADAAARCDLTLEQAAVLAEFADDPETVASLADTARTKPSHFDHMVAVTRRSREDDAARAAVEAQLTDAGVTVVRRPNHNDDRVRRVRDLTDTDGQVLDEQTHASCPGHVATVADWEPYAATYWCTDWQDHGHLSRWGASQTDRGNRGGGPMTEEAKTERRTVIANNKAWDAATDVRRTYVRELLQRTRVPKGTLRYVTEDILRDPHALGRGDDTDLAVFLNDHDTHDEPPWQRPAAKAALVRTSDARLPLLLLAQLVAAHETTMSRDTWRHPNAWHARYLAFLATTGYTLSDVEQLVITTADNASTDDGDEVATDD